MNKIVKNTLILTAITVVAGLLLGVVYGVTKDPIAKAQEKAKQEAFRSVLSDAETFESDTEFDADAASALLKENGYTSDDISEVAEGKDASGETVGYVVNVTSHEGYGGDIDISVGIREDGTVTGIEMLSISETAGLGMKAKEADSFEAMDVDQKAAKEAIKKMGTNATVDEVYSAVMDGSEAGYVITVTDKDGYGGDIQITVGIMSDGTVNGISFLSISETAGLGMRAKEPSFYNQFAGQQAEKFYVSKDGGDGQPIDALSGATITSRAVTGAVNTALGYYQTALGGSGNE